ncbi:MAG: hypothetical protein ACSLFM_01960 [Tepidiformaceae bacterium]
MTAMRLSRLAISLGMLGALITLTNSALAIRVDILTDDPLAPPAWERISGDIFLGAVFGTVGAIVAARRPQNPVGWALLAAGLSLSLGSLVGTYAFLALIAAPDLPAGAAAYQVQAASWPILIGAILYLLVLFPEGRGVGNKWWMVLKVAPFVCVAVAIGVATAFDRLDPPFDDRGNPFHINGLLPFAPLVYAVIVPLLVTVLAAAVQLLRRYRRAAGYERKQFQWLALGAGSILFLLPVTFVANVIKAPTAFESGFLGLLLGFALASLPVSVGIAVLRYRLYDIDVLINRTLVYGSLTAATVGSYVLLVFTLSWAARSVTGEQGNEVVVAATTLIVAALFQPARRRIQRVVDRRFYRSRYDAARTLSAFQARLRDEVDLPTLRDDVARVVSTTLQPQAVGMWLRPGGRP